MGIAETKLTALIAAGKLPPVFSEFTVNHDLTTMDKTITEWKAKSVVPFRLLFKGVANLSQRPKNAAYAVGSKDFEPALGRDETRKNIVMRLQQPFPSVSGEMVLHLDGAELSGDEGSITDWVDSSAYQNRFVPYNAGLKPTVTPFSRDDYPKAVFTGVDSYIYCDEGDDWDANPQEDNPIHDHLVSITGSTIYVSLSIVDPGLSTSNYGAVIDERSNAAESVPVNSGEFIHYGMVNTSGSVDHPSWPVFPKFYAGSDTSGIFEFEDKTNSGMTGSQGDILIFEPTDPLVNPRITMSECIIYNTVHSISEVEQVLRFLYYKHKSDV